MVSFNSYLSFVSEGATAVDKTVKPKQRSSFYRVQGTVSHRCCTPHLMGRIGSLFPAEGAEPRFAQLWVLDTEMALKQRMRYMDGVDENILRELQEMLQATNHLIHNLKTGLQLLRDTNEVLPFDQSIGIHGITISNDRHRFNAATSHEVAGVMSGDGDTPRGPRDLVVSLYDGRAYPWCNRGQGSSG